MKKISSVIFHPVTMFNLLMIGCLGLIEVIHTKAHYDTEIDTHAHASQFLKKNPDMCDQIEY